MLINILKIFLLLGLAGSLLFWSIAKVSWEMVIKDDLEGRLRQVPISFDIREEDGGRIRGEYKVPSSRTLPDHPFYGLKGLRHWMWLHLASGPKQLTQVNLLLADKHLSETIALMEKGNNSLAWETMKQAVSTLELARQSLATISMADDCRKQFEFQIDQALMAYTEVIGRFSEMIEVDQVELAEIINDLKTKNERLD